MDTVLKVSENHAELWRVKPQSSGTLKARDTAEWSLDGKRPFYTAPGYRLPPLREFASTSTSTLHPPHPPSSISAQTPGIICRRYGNPVAGV